MSSSVRSKCFKGKGKGKRARKELEGNACKDAIIQLFSVYAQILRVIELSALSDTTPALVEISTTLI